jgi:transposase
MSNTSSSQAQPFCLYAVGIDVSLEKLDFNISTSNGTSITVLGTGKCDNTPKGFEKILETTKARLKTNDLSGVRFIAEVTGVYQETLVDFLYNKSLNVYVVQPNKAKNFGKGIGQRTKTDKVDAKMLAQYGLTNLSEAPWKPFDPSYLLIKRLTRLRESTTVRMTAMKNQMHAARSQANSEQILFDLLQKQIDTDASIIKDIDKALLDIVSKSSELTRLTGILQSVKGVGRLTALILLAETNGFKDFSNKRQLIAFAGLDVMLHESGKRKGKSTISKRGNAHIRRILYILAGHFLKSDDACKALSNRMRSKKQGRVAVGRKVLTICYALVKKNQMFDDEYRKRTSTPSVNDPITGTIIQQQNTGNSEIALQTINTQTEVATNLVTPVVSESLAQSSEIEALSQNGTVAGVSTSENVPPKNKSQISKEKNE